MRHNLIGEASNVFGAMNEDERRAYSLGISHTYADVFTTIMQVHLSGDGGELEELRRRLHERWTDIAEIQTQLGVL